MMSQTLIDSANSKSSNWITQRPYFICKKIYAKEGGNSTPKNERKFNTQKREKIYLFIVNKVYLLCFIEKIIIILKRHNISKCS